MKYLFVLFCFLTSYSFAASDGQKGSSPLSLEEKEKLRFELIGKLVEAGKLSLSGKKYCENFVRSKHDTVGRFIAWNLSFYSQGQENSIETKCEKQKSGEFCSVIFNADSKGESPWSCGLRFQLESKKERIQSSSLECIGSC